MTRMSAIISVIQGHHAKGKDLMQRSMTIISKLLNGAARVAPPIAGHLALMLFLTPIAQPKMTRGQSVLDAGNAHTLSFENFTLRVYTWGSGPKTILLVHGWRAQSGSMSAFVESLLTRGFRVVAFDAPAHANSSGQRCTLDQYARAIVHVMQTYPPVSAVIAHSFGAAAALRVLAQPPYPIPRAVLIAPPRCVEHAMQRFASTLNLTPRVYAAMQQAFKRMTGRPASAYTVETVAAQIQTRVLIVHDRDDREVPLHEGEAVMHALPHATLMITEGLGHNNPLRDTGVVAQAVDFVAAIEV